MMEGKNDENTQLTRIVIDATMVDIMRILRLREELKLQSSRTLSNKDELKTRLKMAIVFEKEQFIHGEDTASWQETQEDTASLTTPALLRTTNQKTESVSTTPKILLFRINHSKDIASSTSRAQSWNSTRTVSLAKTSYHIYCEDTDLFASRHTTMRGQQQREHSLLCSARRFFYLHKSETFRSLSEFSIKL
ncbi:hypothetical protein KM043_014374 [Ampulex compressa]|nr:hypothetical protein KM043_014374 [Ampulex compressa]